MLCYFILKKCRCTLVILVKVETNWITKIWGCGCNFTEIRRFKGFYVRANWDWDNLGSICLNLVKWSPHHNGL